MKKTNKIISIALAAAILFSVCAFQAFAAGSADESAVSEDPTLWKIENTADTYSDSGTDTLDAGRDGLSSAFSGYTHNPDYDNVDIKYGIDVSEWNNRIDWDAVKADGVEFAIIRVGGRGYGTASNEGKTFSDSNYKENIAGAIDAGIEVGVYFFSQAISIPEAVEEANVTMSLLNDLYNDPNYDVSKSDITLPVVIDFEYAGNPGRLANANLSVNSATNVVMAFCSTVAAAGYEPMVYANLSMFENDLDVSRIEGSYKIWLAQYYKKAELAEEYDFWQFRSNGVINGISGNTDCNFWYKFNPFEDVRESDWFYDYVIYNYEKKYMSGMSATTFEPRSTLTRAMVATILYNIEGAPNISYANSFSDVSAGMWYSSAITWAYQNGVVAGYGDGTFGVNDAVTREQLAQMLYNFEVYRGINSTASSSDLSGFDDSTDVSGWALQAVQWSVAKGIVTGRTSSTLVPGGTAMRAECATMIYKLLEDVE